MNNVLLMMKILLSTYTKRPMALLACSFSCLALYAQTSPYITRVFEYCPAPGQFVNVLPSYSAGDTRDSMAAKAEAALAANKKSIITLGGFGGYVVVGFDHSIVNVAGQADFKVLGNAFWAAANPNASADRRGGSSEPGIVYVSADTNGNGLPDDEWYELAGSEYKSPATLKQYAIHYYRPDENKLKTPDAKQTFLNDTTYIRWTTNGYGNGYMYRNTFHAQPYFPQWLNDSVLSFSGTKLADNYIDESGTDSYYVQYAYPWGYADNAPNTDSASDMNIEWAVDADGKSVMLQKIDFVKIQTGVHQYCGWLGESSTEVAGVTDLHPEALPPTGILVPTEQPLRVEVFTLDGRRLPIAQQSASLWEQLPRGTYIVRIIFEHSKQVTYKITNN